MQENTTVLIVEDDPDVRRSARLALLPHAIAVREVSSPETLEAALTEGAEAVLLDMNFGQGARSGAEGLSALARIRHFDPTLAVVLMTAYGGVTLAVESLKQGAVDFVLKPWRNDKLAAAVLAAVATTQAQRASEIPPLETLERQTIERALLRFKGNISSAAAALGLSRAALYRRMTKHGL
jgi:DNA-binding NtrC family response regulator